MKQKKSMMYVFMEGTAAVYAIMMLVLFPLFYANNFIDISTAKRSFFRVSAIGMVLLIIVFAGMGWLQTYKESVQHKSNSRKKKRKPMPKQESMTKKEAVKKWLSEISVPAWFAVIFVAGVCIATIFSANPQESWQGMEGRKLGLQVFLLCAISYALVGKYLKPGKWLIWIFFAGNIVVCGLAVLNFWAVDPLGMYKNLIKEQHNMFISTIGNVNACSSYFCMIIPAAMAVYMVVETKLLRAASAVFLVLGFWSCYCTVSESWLLGVGTAFLVLLWFAMSDNAHMQRFLEVFGLFWLGSLMMKISCLLGAASGSESMMFLKFQTDKLQREIILNGYLLAAEGILTAAGWIFIIRREKKQKELPSRLLRICVFGIIGAAAGLGIVFLLAANLKEGLWEGSFAFLNNLKIKDNFGSSRGYIWKISLKGWAGLPLWDKITGYGLNCYNMFIERYGGEGVASAFGGAKLVDAHNELLQFMTTTGLLATVGYFGLIIGTAVRSAKRYAEKPIMMLGAVVIGSYLAQGLVNNPTAFITPYLFLLLGIIKSLENLENVKE